MRLFGLIGYPLSHSFSKKYFTEKFEKLGLDDCRYDLFPISGIDQLKEVLDRNPGLTGLNVTIPYKEQVLPFLNEKDAVVAAINACNCISIKNGKLTGYNTDVTGFEQSLKQHWNRDHTKALVLGTGGASKAVGFVLDKLGVRYKSVSRNPSTEHYSYEQLTPRIIGSHTLIVNTTPLGMYPATDKAPPLHYDSITPAHYLFDLVYNPEKTLFLEKGEQKGATIKNGYDMLLIQAEESWRIWNS
jgi:shikimate dehydrogenase